ncbi:uncharacterized protein BO96DRAFT_347144 [Aspergillus niger CBS 101883]|nr:uncharacterized protein BO96DRAFT_347144 [Aspergillus niger CBS 101883]PYH52621.1 hypothetical protein BO96DRAFT_347144 [Aspergillus niger CBS 101883]
MSMSGIISSIMHDRSWTDAVKIAFAGKKALNASTGAATPATEFWHATGGLGAAVADLSIVDAAGGYYALDPEAGDEVRIDSRAVVSRLQNRGEDYTSHAGTGMPLAVRLRLCSLYVIVAFPPEGHVHLLNIIYPLARIMDDTRLLLRTHRKVFRFGPAKGFYQNPNLRTEQGCGGGSLSRNRKAPI